MCTGIKLDYEGASVLARTMDYEYPLAYNIIYLPRDYEYTRDLYTRRLYSKYRVMGLCFENRNPLKDGVNEHGLMGISNSFTGFNLYSNSLDPNKKNISSLDYLNYALMNYRSTDDLLSDLENINLCQRDELGKKVLSPDFHYMFVDRRGRALVLEPYRGRLKAYENPYGIMTNSPSFRSHVKKLKETMDLEDLASFNGAKDLPGGYDPVSRFIKAFYLSKKSPQARTLQEALAYSYSILNSLSLPEGFIRERTLDQPMYTRYISAYDSLSKLLTVKSHINPVVYSLSFDDIRDKDKRHEFFIGSSFETKALF